VITVASQTDRPQNRALAIGGAHCDKVHRAENARSRQPSHRHRMGEKMRSKLAARKTEVKVSAPIGSGMAAYSRTLRTSPG
jgi:hypothetical protein